MGKIRRANMQLRFALLVLLPLIVAARMPRSNDVMVKVTAGESAPSDLGVIWEGDSTAGENFEKLAAILKPGSATIQSTFHEHSFTLRSSDFKFRVRLTIRDRVAKDPDALAFRLTMHNLNHDGNPGSAVELQHGNSGFIWIESGNEVTHTTDAHHHFILRDANKAEIADIVLMPPSRFVSNAVQLYHPRAAFCSMRSALRLSGYYHGTLSVMRISSVRPVFSSIFVTDANPHQKPSVQVMDAASPSSLACNHKVVLRK